ncbi:hypothetical protein AB0N05_11580 [Nocardia sp. NPDC051030]|uniref:hypothetical protein n=1 Tax=Nocardia sp. NPDC051030 TaxID=3155162 RepID=UPI003441EDDF
MTVAVTTPDELRSALERGDREIAVQGRLTGLPGFTVAPGVRLIGDAELVFADGHDGVRITAENYLQGLRITVSDPTRRAVHNDTGQTDLGRMVMTGLTTNGRVQIVAADALRTGHLEVGGLDIEAADARTAEPRPSGFNVDVRQGAFTLYNQQRDRTSLLTADLTGIVVGRENNPVRGSGVFVSGTPGGGRISGTRLHTGAVYTDGGIEPGTAGQITGGVFIGYADFTQVINEGPVTTYGANDMALDLWGDVDEWTAHAPVTTHGPSGIGFVNFGSIDTLRCLAPIITTGTGARGFNLYDGTIGTAEFASITTHADAAVGIQLSRPMGDLIIHGGIETHGGIGQSLVKGEIVTLSAVALSVKAGAHVRHLRVDGGLRVHGMGVIPIEIAGAIDELTIRGGIHPA